VKKLFSVILSAALAAHVAVDAYALSVPAGTKIVTRLEEKVGSATHKKGDVINLTVTQDTFVDGKKVFAAGAPAKGVVHNASKRFIAGIGGNLDIRVEQAQAVDGTWIPVHFMKGDHSGSSLVSVILTVVCCCVFIFIPGKDVAIEKGTLFEVTVVNASDVNAPGATATTPGAQPLKSDTPPTK
jgi:hypothetical protein